jgi:hypothetical protein
MLGTRDLSILIRISLPSSMRTSWRNRTGAGRVSSSARELHRPVARNLRRQHDGGTAVGHRR